MVKKGRSLMWDYFTSLNKAEASCNICRNVFKTTGSSTSSLKKHLPQHHEEFEEYSLKQAEREKALAPFQNKRPAAEMLERQKVLSYPTTWNNDTALKQKQKDFDETLVDMVAETGIAFNVVGTNSFKRVIKVANPKLKVKHPRTISRYTTDRANSVLSDVHDIISAVKHHVPSVGFTTDMWTSLAGDSYCSLTTSFIDEDFKMHRWVPFVKHFPSR